MIDRVVPIDPRIPLMKEGEPVLKTIREALGYSQQELANALGVAVVTVSRWERGVTPATFTVPQMKALSCELKKVGLTIDNLPDQLGPATLSSSSG